MDARATMVVAVARIDEFVVKCEEIFEREREAWLSTTAMAKMLLKASGNVSAAVDDEAEP
eukprot:SAG31_NODE_6771_length_1894_cov_1.070195_2_plen_60_part_00